MKRLFLLSTLLVATMGFTITTEVHADNESNQLSEMAESTQDVATSILGQVGNVQNVESFDTGNLEQAVDSLEQPISNFIDGSGSDYAEIVAESHASGEVLDSLRALSVLVGAKTADQFRQEKLEREQLKQAKKDTEIKQKVINGSHKTTNTIINFFKNSGKFTDNIISGKSKFNMSAEEAISTYVFGAMVLLLSLFIGWLVLRTKRVDPSKKYNNLKKAKLSKVQKNCGNSRKKSKRELKRLANA